jgi:hypothetical protein
MRTAAHETKRTMTFRLTGKAKSDLDRQAELLHVSPGELCRSVIERHLEDGEPRAVLDAIAEVARRHNALAEALEDALSSLEEQVAALRRDFDRALKAPKEAR